MTTKKRFNRRTMLCRSTQAAVFAKVVGHGFGSLLAAPRSRWFKIGGLRLVAGQALRPGRLRRGQADRAGRRAGRAWARVANDMHLRRPEVQKAYLEAAKRTGLEIASLAIGEMNNVPLKSDPARRRVAGREHRRLQGPGADGLDARLLWPRAIWT